MHETGVVEMASAKFLVLFVFLFCSLIVEGWSYLEYEEWLSIEFHHALDNLNPKEFSYRGNVTIPSTSTGLVKTVQEVLSDSERQNLILLAQENKYYRIKAVVVYADGSKQDFQTSTKACSLILSQLNDIIWISFDGTGFVTAVTQTVPGFAADDCKSTLLSTSGLEDFNTDVLIKHMEVGPIPDTASFIQKVEREREAREKGELRDNRGFFAKYWMYIVPVVLLVFISGATNQDAAK